MLPALGLALLAAGCSSGSPVSQRSLSVGVENPPPPPRGALVLGGESGSRAVALAAGKGKLTATVLSPTGGPLSGLKVSFRVGSRVVPARPCGPGCYSARVAAAAPRRAAAEREQAGHLRAPGAPASGGGDRRARGPGDAPAEEPRLPRVAALGPDRRPADDAGACRRRTRSSTGSEDGAEAIVLGTRRWDRDRAGAPWRRSQQLPALTVPLPAWGSRATNAYVLRDGPRRRPAGVGRLLRQPDHAGLVHGLDRPRHLPSAAPADDGRGALHDPPLPRLRPAAYDRAAAMMFLVVLRRSGPDYDHSKPLEEQSGWDEHAAFMDGLVEDGFIVLGRRPRRRGAHGPCRRGGLGGRDPRAVRARPVERLAPGGRLDRPAGRSGYSV